MSVVGMERRGKDVGQWNPWTLASDRFISAFCLHILSARRMTMSLTQVRQSQKHISWRGKYVWFLNRLSLSFSEIVMWKFLASSWASRTQT